MTIDLSPEAATARNAMSLLHAPAGTSIEALEEIRQALAVDVDKHVRLRVLSNGFPVCKVLRGNLLAREIGLQMVAAYLEEHPELEIAGTNVLQEVDTLD
jgi:hypothetical protein